VQDIEGIAETYRKKPLEELYHERFPRAELPETLNEEQRLVIVATELDPQSERIVQFLSSQYGVNINVVFFAVLGLSADPPVTFCPPPS
jgi:hypothetical protein